MLTLTAFLLLAGGAGPFVHVKGGALPSGQRVDDFEMLDHPVTNAEYKLFMDAAKHAAPLHWTGGAIPAGMENHPVIFVNRYDVRDYLSWRTRAEGRIYRLPTAPEFEYAARAGNLKAKYPWGDAPPEGKANYDAAGTRTFGQWREFLKPVKSGAPNAWGLYDMAGNVWQLTVGYQDQVTARFKYRVEDLTQVETGLAGGSWARSEYYLRCDVRGYASSGIRHPDIGFRVVREPAGQSSFHRQPRRVVAANAGNGAVFLSWQLLPGDKEETGFHIYRATRPDVAGNRITTEPVRGATNYTDAAPGSGRTYYRVRAVDAAGNQGPPSEWSALEPGGPRSGLIAQWETTEKKGNMAPEFGDLDGDGVLDLVVRMDNGIQEMSRDPGVPVEMEAFTSYGRQLWRRKLVYHDHCFGSANNVPFVVFDMDGDGKAEVLTRYQEGDQVYLAMLDGMTGRVRKKTPWTPMMTDFAKSSTRIHMSVAYLDGKHPAVVTQTGLYENEIFDAFDANLNKLWQYRSTAETNGSGSHHIDIADVDGDGRDEVFDGTTVLNPDGTLRWSIYREHPDIVSVKHILPGAKGLQVYYAVESSVHAGAYLVDAKTGKIIWKVNREDDPRWTHAHYGWASDIWEGSPGMEMLTNRDGHLVKELVLFSAEGKILADPFPGIWRPVNWTGGKVRELINGNATQIGRFNGKTVDVIAGLKPNESGEGGCGMTADVAGDYRDEIVCVGGGKVSVYMNLEPAARRQVTRTADREYRLWMARNIGGGYYSYFE